MVAVGTLDANQWMRYISGDDTALDPLNPIDDPRETLDLDKLLAEQNAQTGVAAPGVSRQDQALDTIMKRREETLNPPSYPERVRRFADVNPTLKFAYDINEAILGLGTGAASMAVTTVQAVSEILNRKMRNIAKEGPFPIFNQPSAREIIDGKQAWTKYSEQSPTFYRDTFKKMEENAAKYTYQPKSAGGQALMDTVMLPIHGVKMFADLAGAGAEKLGLDPDVARLLAFGVEFVTLYKMDAAVRKAAPKVRAKVAQFSDTLKKLKTDREFANPDNVKAAQELYDAFQESPDAPVAVQNARLKLLENIKREPSANDALPTPIPDKNPALIPRLRESGENILQRLNESPDNVETLNNAAAFVERTRGLGDARLDSIAQRIGEITGHEIERQGPPTPPPSSTPLPEAPKNRYDILGDIANNPTLTSEQKIAMIDAVGKMTDEQVGVMIEGLTAQRALAAEPAPQQSAPVQTPPPTPTTDIRSEPSSAYVETPKPTVLEEPIPNEVLSTATTNKAADLTRGISNVPASNRSREIAQRIRDEWRESGVELTDADFQNLVNDIEARSGSRTTAPITPEVPSETPLRQVITTALDPNIAAGDKRGALETVKLAARERLKSGEPIERGMNRLVTEGILSPREAETLIPQIKAIRVKREPVVSETPPAPKPEQKAVTSKPSDSPYVDMAKKVAKEEGVPDEMVPSFLANTEVESNWNPNAVSSANAKGLGQLIDSTAKRYGVTDPFNPEQNLRGAARYWRDLSKMFNNDQTKVAAAYNAGEGRVKAAGGVPNIAETINHVAKVNARTEKYGGIDLSFTQSGPIKPTKAPQQKVVPAEPVLTEREIYSLKDPGLTAIVPRGTQFLTPKNAGEIDLALGGGIDATRLTNRGAREPFQVLTKADNSPMGIAVDTESVGNPTSLERIQQDVASGKTSTEIGAALQAKLQRISELFDVPIEQAHLITPDTILHRAMEIAQRNNTELYRARKGADGKIEYRQIPREAIDTTLKLADGDMSTPKNISAKDAAIYTAEKRAEVTPEIAQRIRDALEQNDETIAATLPDHIRDYFLEELEKRRQTLESSEPRSMAEILGDLRELVFPSDAPRIGRGGILGNERGTIGREGLTQNQRVAVQNLKAEAIRRGKSLRDWMFQSNFSPVQITLAERYLESLQRPIPASLSAADPRLDPMKSIPGDQIVKHRTRGNAANGTYREMIPVWNSEASAVRNAKELIKPFYSFVELPWRQIQEVGLREPITVGYRMAERARDFVLREFRKDIGLLSRDISAESAERIGAYGYAQDPAGNGAKINKHNKVATPTLTPREMQVYNASQAWYKNIFDQLNEARQLIGQDPLTFIDNYQTFARTFTLLEQLGIGHNLMHTSSRRIQSQYNLYVNTPFPHAKGRSGALYSAEYNIFRLMDKYAESAYQQIYMGPFVAKMHELINTGLPNPKTGKNDWYLRKEKPILWETLKDWNNTLASGSNWRQHHKVENAARMLTNNLAYSYLAGNFLTAIKQISSQRLTIDAIGVRNAMAGWAMSVEDIWNGGKNRKFALEHSAVLDSRRHNSMFDTVQTAIVGRRPKDFVRAIKQGRVGELQQAIAAPGFIPLEWVDMESAIATWNGAYRMAKKEGLSGIDAYRRADDMVVRTQGGVMPGDKAPIQQNVLGRSATQFQTFVINEWNYLTHDVLQFKQPVKDYKLMAYNIAKLALVTQAFNFMFDLATGSSPFPNPIRAVWDGLGDEDDGIIKAAGRAAAEFAEVVPGASATRYGKGLGGPTLETGRDVAGMLRGDPLAYQFTKKDDDLLKFAARMYGSPLAKLAGLPFSSQVAKFVRASDQGATFTEALLGYYEPYKPRSSEGLNRLRTGGEGLNKLR